MTATVSGIHKTDTLAQFVPVHDCSQLHITVLCESERIYEQRISIFNTPGDVAGATACGLCPQTLSESDDREQEITMPASKQCL